MDAQLSKLLSCLEEEANDTSNLEVRWANTDPGTRYVTIALSGGFAAAQAKHARLGLFRALSRAIASQRARIIQGSEKVNCGSR